MLSSERIPPDPWAVKREKEAENSIYSPLEKGGVNGDR